MFRGCLQLAHPSGHYQHMPGSCLPYEVVGASSASNLPYRPCDPTTVVLYHLSTSLLKPLDQVVQRRLEVASLIRQIL